MSHPIPFIVGVARSGTTLLRMMLDAHSQLAIPPETGFIPALTPPPASVEAFLDVLCASSTWPDLHLSRASLQPLLQAAGEFTAAGGLDVVYRAYAARFGKPRWGDKTPLYCLHMPAVQDLFPEACFIHVIRDGRDVAASVRHLWFTPGTDMAVIAADWRDRILTARRDAVLLRRYIEVRYEELVHDPKPVLERLCDALGLAFEPDMLAYHTRALSRLREHVSRHAPDGTLVISHEQRVHNQRFTMQPPTTQRIGLWRESFGAAEHAAFLSVAETLLEELGYRLP